MKVVAAAWPPTTRFPAQCHITTSSRHRWERYSAMLAAARPQAAAAAPGGTAGSSLAEDAAQHNMPAAANGAAGSEAADAEDAGRPTKRARTATPAEGVAAPPQHGTARSMSHAQRPAAEAEGSAGQAAGVVAAGSHQALAAEQLDGSHGCHAADTHDGWPPDMHDTVGCVVVDANGASLHGIIACVTSVIGR